MKQRPWEEILKDLPQEEPWLELRFHLNELDTDLGGVVAQLHEAKLLIGVKQEARRLAALLDDVYSRIDHATESHAARARELTQHLRVLPVDAIPVRSTAGASRLDFNVPTDILACTSLQEAQSQVALHLEETRAAVEQAHQAVLRAAEMTGPRHVVLDQVLKEAARCHELLQDSAWPHAQRASHWSEPYWRLMSPEEATALDESVSREEAAIEAELASHQERLEKT